MAIPRCDKGGQVKGAEQEMTLEEIQQAVREQQAINDRLIAAGKRLCKGCRIVLHPECQGDYCTCCRLKRAAKSRYYGERRAGYY